MSWFRTRRDVDLLEDRVTKLDRELWELRRSFAKLLDKLGYVEHKIPQRTVLCSKSEMQQEYAGECKGAAQAYTNALGGTNK